MSDISEQANKPNNQRTLILIKPDAVQRGLVGSIIAQIEKLGLKILKIEMKCPGKAQFEKHYFKHADQEYFQGLTNYMASGPIVVVVWQGPNAVHYVRKKVAGFDKTTVQIKTIRGSFAPLSSHFVYEGDNKVLVRNVCHASDSKEEAEREIKIWFPSQRA